MALNIHVNHSSIDSPLLTSGVDWVLLDVDNDSLIITDGSDTVKDGESIPSQSALNSAGVVLDGTEQIYDKYILSDFSANELKEIFLMGESNSRYVLCFEFTASTTSEPVLEAWDDSTYKTIANVVLGSGVASASWLRAITTTDALPGASWTGSRLAGSSDGNFLWLNNENGALSVAKNLYATLQCVIPATQIDAGASTPIIVCKYTTV